MAVDFSILQRTPTIGSRIMAGQQMAREQALQNRLLARQDLQFQQQQEDRARGLEAERAGTARRQQLAQLLQQSNMDPTDLKSAQQFYSVALQANEPNAIKAAQDWVKMASEAQQKRQQTEATRAEMASVFGPQAGAAPAAAAPGMGMPPVTSTLIDEGASRPEARVPLSIEGGAQAMPVQPQGAVTTRDISTGNALAPAAPAAAPQNRLVTREQVQRGLMSTDPAVRAAATAMARTLPPQEAPGAAESRAIQERRVQLEADRLELERRKADLMAQRDVARAQNDAAAAARFQTQLDQADRRLAMAEEAARRAAAPKPDFTPAQLQKRRDTLGKEYKSAVAALQTTQDVLDSVTQVKESEGLSRATGFTGTMLPSFPGGEAAFAETRLKNLKGKVTALGKAAAAATGSIGQIANQEWKILADQIAAIEEIKGTGPLLEQLDLLEAQAQGTMQRIKDAYDKQFGEDFERFPQFAELPEPKSVLKRAPQGRGQAGVEAPQTPTVPAAVSPDIDALLKKYP